MSGKQATELSRRQLLGGGAALLIGLSLPLPGRAQAAGSGPFAPNAFLRIGDDDRVTILSKHIEFGQGAYTGLATALAEELDADWASLRVEAAPSDPAIYNNLAWGPAQGTGGSTSMANSFMQMRQAGAMARAMLLEAAAQRWSVPPSALTVSRGTISHAASGRAARFGELTAEAATLPAPAEVSLKTPADFTLIGKGVPRVDTPGKLDGSAIYGLDIRRPGMLTAVLARPPLFGATLKGFRDTAARAVPGVTDVVETPRGVAVLGRNFWAAKTGRDALELDWDLRQAETRGDDELATQFQALAERPGLPARREGDIEAALAGAATSVAATYVLPFLAHTPMEPLNCLIELGADGCDLWLGSQIQTIDHTAAAGILGLPFEKVRLHTLLAGGSFGRRGTGDGDVASEAAFIVKAIDGRAPVKVVWTREDDVRGGRYRGLFVHRLSGGLGADGRIAVWRQRVVGQSLAAGSFLEPYLVHDGIDASSVEGAAGLPYAVPHVAVELHTVTLPITTLWWRSGGNSHTAFAVESFIDELAHAAGADPLAFRLAHLDASSRQVRALRRAAELAGWNTPLPEGRARGLAVHETFGTVVAEVAEISRHPDGGPKVERVTCAVDCGLAVNPDIVRAQIEGAVGYGLGALLHEEITLEGGRVQQSNFHDYPPLRMAEMPAVTVDILPSDAPPSGIGEAGTPPILAAVANAWFALTGERVRRLPFHRQAADI